MAITHDVTSILNDLIEICRDGETGFANAAASIDDPSLRDELSEYSNQRREFASELQSWVDAAGEDHAEHGSVSGAIHRGWMNLRTALASNDRYAILAECERGEDAAVKSFRKAAESDLPSECDQLVQSQYETVMRTHDRIRALRDSLKH